MTTIGRVIRCLCDQTSEVVRFSHYIENRRRLAVTNPHRSHFDAEKRISLASRPVKPVNSCPVFVANLSCNPDTNARVKLWGVSQNLPQVPMVCLIQLIFDDHFVVGADNLCDDVRIEGSDRSLNVDPLKTWQTETVSQKLQIFWLRQPRIESIALMSKSS